MPRRTYSRRHTMSKDRAVNTTAVMVMPGPPVGASGLTVL